MLHADSIENMGGLIVDRIPKPRVSAMDNLLTGFNFVVSLNEFTYGFQNVSNLQRHREVGYHMEGGVNDHQIMVGRPNDNIYTLSLRRGYIIHAPDDVINKFQVAAAARIPNETARKAALLAINSSSPQAALENGPSLGFIQVYSRRKKLVAMFSFLSLGMTEWTLSDLDAHSSDALFENITIAHTGLTLLPATWLPSVTQPLMGWMGASEDSMATMTEIMERNKREFEKRQKQIKELDRQKRMLDDERMDLLHRRDELLAERAKKAEDKKKEAEKAKEEQAKANAEALKARQEEAKKSEEARKEVEKAKEEQAKANAEALKARQEEAKKSEEARKEAEKAKEEQAKANAEALKARQEQQKSDYERRMEAQQGRTARQDKQDKASAEKVHEATGKAEQNMKNENNS